MSNPPAPDHVEYGYPEVALPHEILRSVVGSGVHSEHRDDYIWRTQPEGVRSRHRCARSSGCGSSRSSVAKCREEVSEEIDGIETEIRDLLHRGACAVPLHPDRPAIEKWSTAAHRRTWGW